MADRIKGITIEIGGDTTGLSKALSGTNKEIRSTQSQLKDVERLLKLDPSNTELLRQKQKLLADAVGETKTKLDTLKEAEKQAQSQFKEGKISEDQYKALKREIIETEQQLEKLEGQAGKSNVALQKISQAGDKVKEFGGKVSSAGRELSKVSAGLAAVGGASAAAWKTVDEAYDLIAKGTGATGEALEGMQKSFDNVFSSIPTEAAAAGGAIADINTRFGFTGDVLEDCTIRFLKFAEVNNTDVSTAIANVSRYMGDAGIESSKYGEVLDQLTAASQASGLGVDKLSESLTKYGAPMRALGFDTKESIAIFAGWEKAGVNTEIAFSGMKAAIGKWSKQGKDARKEFKKTLDEIAACPDIASATGKAIEAFGQKAGPDLADAIQGGRFEYEDFLEVIDGSQGQLEQTFSDITDPIDGVQVAMQGLTLQGSKLGGELLKTLAPMITALTDKIKELTSWFDGLSEDQKEMIVKIGLVVAALGPLLMVVGQITTGIGGLMTAISAVGPAIGALGMAGGPVLLAVAAVAALGAAFLKAKDDSEKYRETIATLSEQEEANKQKVDELYESYDAMSRQRADAAGNAEAEAQREQDLFTALQGVTDENGNVKEGYEERANYIKGELAEALGIEIDLVDTLLKKYKEEGEGIDALILKKQANALIDANAGAYAEAIKNQTDAFMAYNDAQKNVEETKAKLADAQRREVALQSDLNTLQGQGIQHLLGISNESAYLAAYVRDASEEVKGYQDKLAELNETMTDAENTYVGYRTVISNQDALIAAKDNQDLLADAVMKASNNFQTAETGTRESLERQVADLTAKYQEMQAAVDAGAPGIAQTQADNMAKLVEESKKELDKLPSAFDLVTGSIKQSLESKGTEFSGTGKSTGEDYSAGLVDGMEAGKDSVANVAGNVASAGIDATQKELKQLEPTVQAGYAPAIDYITELSQKSPGWGVDMMSGYIRGIRGKTPELETAVQSVADTVSSYMHFTRPDKGPLRYYEQWMPHMMQGLARGIKQNTGLVGEAAEGTANTIGEELAKGIADGVRENKDNAKKSAEDIAKVILDEAGKRLKNEKVYRELSLAQEVHYWESVRKQIDKGTQARIDADAKYYAAKKDLNSQMQSAEESYTDHVADAYQKLNDKIKQLNQEYQNAVTARTEAIQNAYGLFDEFGSETELTTDDLLNNLQSQVEGLQQWRNNLRDLEHRGIGEDLLSELEDLGPQAAAQIQLLTEMSDDELDYYVNLFRQKNRIARRQAVAELEPMRDEISKQIRQMQMDTTAELSKYKEEYISAMQELGVSINQPLEAMKLTAAQNAVALVTTMADTVKKTSGEAENVDKFKEIAKNVLGASSSLPVDMQAVGVGAVAGIITGLRSKEAELYATVQSIARRITEVMQTELGVEPSFARAGRMADRLSVQNAAPAAAGISSTISSEIVSLLNSYLPEIAEQKMIALDGKTLVGKTVGSIDRQISNSQTVKGRTG